MAYGKRGHRGIRGEAFTRKKVKDTRTAKERGGLLQPTVTRENIPKKDTRTAPLTAGAG